MDDACPARAPLRFARLAWIAALGLLIGGSHGASGQSWYQTTAPDLGWTSVACSTDGVKVVAVADDFPGLIYLSTNGGASWTQANTPIGKWTSVASSANGSRLVAVGNDFPAGPVCVSSDSGVNWSYATAPAHSWSSVASSADGQRLVIVGNDFPNGPIYYSATAGTTWLPATAPAASWMAVAASADGTKWLAAGNNPPVGPVHRSTDNGASWVASLAPAAAWTAAASSADGSRLFIAAGEPHNIVYRSANSGVEWSQGNLSGLNFSALAVSANGLWVVASDRFGGGIHRSTDGGLNWTNLLAPSQSWSSIASSADGTRLVAVAYGGGVYTWPPTGPPRILVQPTHQPFVLGGNVTFSVDAIGTEPMTNQWQFQGMDLAGRTSRVLTLTNMVPAQAGVYTVRIGNTYGSITSSNAVLMASLPVIVQQPAHQPLIPGSNVTFSVDVTGTAPFAYQWRRDSSPLSNATNRLLTLQNVSLANAGVYTVRITNLFGEVVSEGASLARVAPLATTRPAAITSSSGAVLQGSATPRDVGALAWFEWGTNTAYGQRVGWTNLPGGYGILPVQAVLTGLALPPIYHCRLVVSNGVGITPGADQPFVLGRRVLAWSGDFADEVTVITAPDNSDLVALAAGTFHGIALRNNSTVFAWGDASQEASVPSNLTNVAAIAAASGFNLALRRTGTVVGWPDCGGCESPVTVPGGLANVIAISISEFHSLAVKRDGTVTGWGYSNNPGLDLPVGLDHVVAAAAGNAWSLALRDDGTVVAWGDDAYGQVSGAAGLTNVIAIAAGPYHGLALKRDGTVTAWGDNSTQLTNVPSGLTGVVAIAANRVTSLALQAGGMVVGWGETVTVPAGWAEIASIAAGDTVRLALSTAVRLLPLETADLVEGDGSTNAIIRVALNAAQSRPVSVQYATMDGTALAGSDYVTTNGTLVFAPGETNKTILVPVLGDVVQEDTEVFELRLSNPDGAVLPYWGDTLLVKIINDDEAPVILSQPRDQTATAGADTVLAVAATGSLPLQFQWRRNGAAIPGANQSVLALTSLSLADSGSTFDVRLSNKVATVLSSPAVLTVRTNPAFPGELDPSFSVGLGATGRVYALAMQPDGKVLLGGAFTAVHGVPRRNLARLNADGTVDTAFDTGLAIGAEVRAVAVQPDGKVVVGGRVVGGPPVGRLARFSAAGELDTNFIDSLSFNSFVRVNDLLVEPDGKLLIGGNMNLPMVNGVFGYGMARLHPDGSVDTNFAIGTGFDGEVLKLARQADGKLLAVGNFFTFNGTSRRRIARLNADGSLDAAFVPQLFDSQQDLFNSLKSVVSLPDGRVLIGGERSGTRPCVARLLPDGRLDQSFVPSALGNFQQAPVHAIETLLLQDDGKILIGGTFTNINRARRGGVARLHPGGALDASFAPIPGADGTVFALAQQASGRVILGGAFTNVSGRVTHSIARLHGDDGPPRLGLQPAGAEGTVGFPISLTVTVTNGRPPLQFRWCFNNADVPGGTASSLTLSNVQPAHAGDYSVVVSNALGVVTSSVATLTTVTGPRLLSAGSVDGLSVGLCFSVPVTAASATNPARYALSSGGPITNVTLRPDGRTVALRLQSPADPTFTVTATQIADAGPGNLGGGMVTARSEGLGALTLGPPSVRGSAFACRPGQIELSAGGADISGTTAQGYFVYSTQNGNFDVKVRVNHLSWANALAKGGLMASPTLSPGSNLNLHVTPAPPASSFFDTSGPNGSWRLPIHGAFDGYPPDSWLRLQRVGSQFSGFVSSNGLEWTLYAQTLLPSFPANLFVGMDLTARDPRLTNSVALFSDFGPWEDPLTAALDMPGLVWSPSGNQPWFAQTVTTHDSTDALQSGAIADAQASTVATTVLGPGTVSYWWKVSSEPLNDRLAFHLNAAEQFAIAGEQDWELRTLAVPVGFNMLSWTYSKNGSVSQGIDAAWLDQVTFVPSPGPPVIFSEPADVAVKATSNALFTVTATNATGLSMHYRWFFNQTQPLGSNSPTLLITNVGAGILGGYQVVVSNSVGTVTSRVATLEILTLPVIVQQPQPRTVIAGDDVTFTVTVTNTATLPVNYRWRKNSFTLTNMLLHSRTSSFTLFNVATNVTFTNGPGNYSVVVSNAASPPTQGLLSTIATLTVLPATAPGATTLAASGLTPNGATLHASVHPMGARTVAWFEYGLTTAYGSRTLATQIGNDRSAIPFDQTLTSLLPDTNYHYRVVATNYGGIAQGADLTFQTQPSTPPLMISSFNLLPGGQFRLQFASVAGAGHTVLVSTNLHDWTLFGPAIELAPGQFEFTDTNAATLPARFYQLRSP